MNIVRRIAFLAVLIFSPYLMAGPSHSHMVEYLDARIAKHPDDPVVYLRRANAYAELGYWDHAFEDLARVQRLGQTYTAALTRGVFYTRMGKYSNAIVELNKVLKEQPDNYRALTARAEAFILSNKKEKALSDYLHILEIKPNSASGFYRQTAKLLVETGHSDKALSILDKRIAQIGAVPQLQDLAIDIERAEGRSEAAIQRMELLHPLVKSTPYWMTDMAELNLELGRKDKARDYIQTAEALVSEYKLTQSLKILADRIALVRNNIKLEAPENKKPG